MINLRVDGESMDLERCARTRSAFIVLASLAAMTLTGCGEDSGPAVNHTERKATGLDSLSAAELLKRANTQFMEASTLHLRTSRRMGASLDRIEMTFVGDDAFGSVTKNGATMRLLSVAGRH
jgi:hypothetical protein